MDTLVKDPTVMPRMALASSVCAAVTTTTELGRKRKLCLNDVVKAAAAALAADHRRPAVYSEPCILKGEVLISMTF